jgi:hypothetical protein
MTVYSTNKFNPNAILTDDNTLRPSSRNRTSSLAKNYQTSSNFLSPIMAPNSSEVDMTSISGQYIGKSK